MSSLPTLGIPLCPYCKYEMDFGAVQFICHCDGFQEQKRISAEAMRDRMASEHGWKEQDLLGDIQREAGTIV